MTIRSILLTIPLVLAGCGTSEPSGAAQGPAGPASATPAPVAPAPKLATTRPAPASAAGSPSTTAPAASAASPAAPVPPASPKPAPAADPAQLALGERVYNNLCLTCHGRSGLGDGSLVPGLPVKPRAFAGDEWRFVDFTAGEAAARDAIRTVIRQGIPEAMMPGYGTSLSAAQIDAVVAYVLELRRRGRP